MKGKLILHNGMEMEGESFGFPRSVAGEVVFATGMVGYPESLTDPSFAGQILVYTYPLIGNYGVANAKSWESDKLQVSGLVVSDYIDTPSHYTSKRTLREWLVAEKIPALVVKDTRLITQTLRTAGSMLGKVVIEEDLEFADPNKRNLVSEVSTKKVQIFGKGKYHVVLIDCGTKRNIVDSLVARGMRVTVVPWNTDIFAKRFRFDGLVVSNGPGDPKMAGAAIKTVKKAMARGIPIFGICLGNQILALAAGGNTSKLKFGHRGQNQPCLMVGTERCFLTTQNHGYAVTKVPKGFRQWFINANDQTNEGLIHKERPWFSVQFHPEATPGPWDTTWLFDEFLKRLPKA